MDRRDDDVGRGRQETLDRVRAGRFGFGVAIAFELGQMAVIGGEPDNVIFVVSGSDPARISEGICRHQAAVPGFSQLIVNDGSNAAERLGDQRWPPSLRRPQFAREPTHGVGLHGIYRHRELFSSLAGGAFERADFEAAYAGGDARQRHPVLACWTHRPVFEAVHYMNPKRHHPQNTCP
jgi:hypothetical protein